MYSFSTPLTSVKGIGTKIAQQLAESNMYSVEDLLFAFPLRYEDKSQFFTISEAPIDLIVTIKATITEPKSYYKNRRKITRATAVDETGKVSLIWFNRPGTHKIIQPNTPYLVSGKINSHKSIIHPTIEPIRDVQLHTGRLVPVYSSKVAMNQGSLRRIIHEILSKLTITKDEILTVAEKLGFPVASKHEALHALHFPDEIEKVISGRERFALEEMIALIQRSRESKKEWSKKKAITVLDSSVLAESMPPLPFTLTAGQKQATHEILTDLTKEVPMNRLLIGDVGAGKTVVAAIAAKKFVEAGHSVALVAPTKILATQHVKSMQVLFPTLPVCLITQDFKKNTIDGTPQLYIGTHALLNRLMEIHPNFVIYDEQHKFGVTQRTYASQALVQPHVLTMTATPIPRTLLLTIFSHLSMSYIADLPPGRLPIKTWAISPQKQAAAYAWMLDEIAEKKAQVFIVCPFIQQSEAPSLQSVASIESIENELNQHIKTHGSNPKIRIVHSQIPKDDQQQIMRECAQHEIDILLATPMIEVGVDVPDASIILIHSAERFGLASLHQLRGRVGRRNQQAYCVLVPSTDKSGVTRLKKFASITDGLSLSELDLENRGAGDIFGTSQHGILPLRFGDWTNSELIYRAKAVADAIDLGSVSYTPPQLFIPQVDVLPQAN